MCLRGQIEVHSSSDTHSAVVTPIPFCTAMVTPTPLD